MMSAMSREQKEDSYYLEKRRKGLIGDPSEYSSDYSINPQPVVSMDYRQKLSEEIGTEIDIFEVT